MKYVNSLTANLLMNPSFISDEIFRDIETPYIECCDLEIMTASFLPQLLIGFSMACSVQFNARYGTKEQKLNDMVSNIACIIKSFNLVPFTVFHYTDMTLSYHII